MASSIPKLILLLSLLSSLSISTSARPCKTLFISSYTFSIRPLNPNPNTHNPSSGGFVTIVTEISQQNHHSSDVFLVRSLDDDSKSVVPQKPHPQKEVGAMLPFGLGISNYDMNSLRDRTKDILSVVFALLFGVGCGALTAATMYLVWSLFFASRYDCHYDDEFDGDDVEDDISAAKKLGYVKIAEVDAQQAKEVVFFKTLAEKK